jgi:hypothetical protein
MWLQNSNSSKPQLWINICILIDQFKVSFDDPL